MLMASGIHAEAAEEDVLDAFSDHGKVKSLTLNLDRRSGFAKGYALLEYASRKEAEAAIAAMNGAELLGQKLAVDFAFMRAEGGSGGGGGGGGKRHHHHGHGGRRH